MQREFNPPEKVTNLLAYVSKYKKQFIFTAIAGILYNTIVVLGPIFQGKLLDVAISANGIKSIIKSGVEFILITLTFQVARFFKRYYVRDMSNKISGDMRVGITKSILNTNLNEIEKRQVGDMMSTTISDVDVVVEAIRKTITEMWDTWVLMIAYFLALMFYDIKITLICVIPIPISILIAQCMKKIVQTTNKKYRKANGNTTSQVRNMISEINILRLYGREENELKKLKEKLDIQKKEATIALVLKSGLGPIYSAVSTVGIVLVISLGSNEVIKGKWSVGTLTAYIIMFTSLSNRTRTAAKVFNIQQGAKASWERIKNLISIKYESNNRKEDIGIINSIKLQNVNFKYPMSKENAIKNITLNAKRGMIIGVTGSVGSGKSALALALTGAYPYEGSIKLNNDELINFSADFKSKNITYMGHNPFLFSSSIEHNITWKENEDDLSKVLETTSLIEDIEKMEFGKNTKIGENGVKISGGQKQRIALARALYREAQIIILDDPFSAVDINTEQNIIRKLNEQRHDKIIFIFSHRLDVFKYTDKVIVLDEGQIVEEGSHDELVSNKGIYEKIIECQSYLESGEVYEKG